MAFEIVEPGATFGKDALTSGTASISRSGRLTVVQEDLELAGIDRTAVVLADPGTLRIALRAPREDETAVSVACSPMLTHAKRDTGRRALNIVRALRRLSLTPEAAAGRYELATKGAGADALLIVNLGASRDRPKPGQA